MLQVGKGAYREVRYRRVVPYILHSNPTITNPNPNPNLNPICKIVTNHSVAALGDNKNFTANART